MNYISHSFFSAETLPLYCSIMSNRVKPYDQLENNPCLKEQNMSYECLNRNNFDNEKCEDYFDNYNACKKFWGRIEAMRRQKNIYPNMPTHEEREKIRAERAEMLKNGKFSM